MRTGKIDKQKKIEEMLENIQEYFPTRDYCKEGRKCIIKNGLADCNNCLRSTALYNAGYRNIKKLMHAENTEGLDELELEFFIKHNEKVRKETAREILNKVYNEIEKARLESEFQDENGKWLIDESEFMSEFTLGKLYELYAEYGVEVEE
jgi:hypothetical protein|nr:MAG TPA: hypothetical protein [Caudoviricetes sp.]